MGKITQWRYLLPALLLTYAGPAFALTVNTKEELISKVLCPIFNYLFFILILTSIIMVLWAAFIYATSNGSPEKVSQANRALIYAASGIAAALFAKAVPAIVAGLLKTSIGRIC